MTPPPPNFSLSLRLDLITQINEIEARKEEYPETIAFIRQVTCLATCALWALPRLLPHVLCGPSHVSCHMCSVGPPNFDLSQSAPTVTESPSVLCQLNSTLNRLLNSLVAAAAAASPASGGGSLPLGGGGGSGGGAGAEGGGGAAGAGGGQELLHFTAFVVHHVLAHLWQRAYKWVWEVLWGEGAESQQRF